MKRCLLLTIAVSLLLISTTTAMPVVNTEPVNEILKQNELKERFINRIGEDKYNELGVVATKITEGLSKGVLEGPYLYEELLEILKMIGLTVTQLLLILFGMNVVGMFISLALTCIIMAIPVLLLSVVASIEIVFLDFIDSTIDIGSLPELVEFLGVFGMIIFVIVFVPLLLLLSLVALPFTSSAFFAYFMGQILNYIVEEIA